MYKRDDETVTDYLERIPSFAREKSPLSQVRRFLELLDHPDREFKIFHVAGTNGKGSVCAFLTAVLKEAGKSCGTFTSPHLELIRERFMTDGVMVSEEDFETAFYEVYRAVLIWTGMGNPHPTYFEFLFFMALLIFRRAGVEYMVLETGMGGLKDVTNVVEKPLVSVITSISIDHTAYLGDSIGEIASHKAGIIKSGCPVVYDTACGPAAEIIEKQAKELGAVSYGIGRAPYCSDGETLAVTCSWQGQEEVFYLPFAAPYQAANGALAVRALEVSAKESGIKLSAEVLREGLKKAVWPARMEKIRQNVYLDGAHNEDGVRAFLQAACLLKEQKKPGRTLLLFAVSADKDYRRMLKKIGEQLKPDLCFLTRMDSIRGLPVEILHEAACEAFSNESAVQCYGTVKDALSALFLEKTGEDLAFIAGSLYLAGEIKKETEHDKF